MFVCVCTLSMMARASFPTKHGKGEWLARVLRLERIVSTLARKAKKPAKKEGRGKAKGGRRGGIEGKGRGCKSVCGVNGDVRVCVDRLFGMMYGRVVPEVNPLTNSPNSCDSSPPNTSTISSVSYNIETKKKKKKKKR